LRLCERPGVTAKEWTCWMNSKHGSLQKLQTWQRTCYKASRQRWTIGGMWDVGCYRWRSLWSVLHLTTCPLVCKEKTFHW
jgi:hypothetical protein